MVAAPKQKKFNSNHKRHESRWSMEKKEIDLLETWIASGKPDSGSNPLSVPPQPPNSRVGRLCGESFSPYAGVEKFDQLPLSKSTKKGLLKSGFSNMTDIQRASIPHSLCGRNILGAAKTGSGKTLAFIIPVLEKLYRARWEYGVGCIIMSPERELASQLFEVLKSVGSYHDFTCGLLIGGNEVDTEKELVNDLNILVCTPGRLLQHMDETQNFECPNLQVLVLDEADRLLDRGFKKDIFHIVSQLPKKRQTLLFSATQTKSDRDLVKLGLVDREYISVHEKAETATPSRLKETAVIVPLDKKLEMLWMFLKEHKDSRILVFFASRNQVKFVMEAFKKLRPGIPLKSLHGKMKSKRRKLTYEGFCEKQASVLFSTDVSSRGLDFNNSLDWVVQVDCPDDVKSYIHRVGRTARYNNAGKSILFLDPSEMHMLEKLKKEKIPIRVMKAKAENGGYVSKMMSALLVQYPPLCQQAERACVTYIRSIRQQSDKEVFDVSKLPVNDFRASMGLLTLPEIKCLKMKGKTTNLSKILVNTQDKIACESPYELLKTCSNAANYEADEDILKVKEENTTETKDVLPITRASKKKKLKIKVDRPMGTKIVFDDEGDNVSPLARQSNISNNMDSVNLNKNEVLERYAKLRKDMEVADEEDKALQNQRLREQRLKQKMKRSRYHKDYDSDGVSTEDESSSAAFCGSSNKKSKINVVDGERKHSDNDVTEGLLQLALKMLREKNSQNT